MDVFSRDDRVYAVARLPKKRPEEQWWEEDERCEVNYTVQLGPDVLENIFGCLSFKRLCRLGCVSKQWATTSRCGS